MNEQNDNTELNTAENSQPEVIKEPTQQQEAHSQPYQQNPYQQPIPQQNMQQPYQQYQQGQQQYPQPPYIQPQNLQQQYQQQPTQPQIPQQQYQQYPYQPPYQPYQQPYQYQQYPYQQPMYYRKPKIPGRGFGITSMIMGILSVFSSLSIISDIYSLPLRQASIAYFIYPCIYIVLAIVFGGISLSKKYKGMSIAGVILGSISLLICILAIIALMNTHPSL